MKRLLLITALCCFVGLTTSQAQNWSYPYPTTPPPVNVNELRFDHKPYTATLFQEITAVIFNCILPSNELITWNIKIWENQNLIGGSSTLISNTTTSDVYRVKSVILYPGYYTVEISATIRGNKQTIMGIYNIPVPNNDFPKVAPPPGYIPPTLDEPNNPPFQFQF